MHSSNLARSQQPVAVLNSEARLRPPLSIRRSYIVDPYLSVRLDKQRKNKIGGANDRWIWARNSRPTLKGTAGLGSGQPAVRAAASCDARRDGDRATATGRHGGVRACVRTASPLQLQTQVVVCLCGHPAVSTPTAPTSLVLPSRPVPSVSIRFLRWHRCQTERERGSPGDRRYHVHLPWSIPSVLGRGSTQRIGTGVAAY